MLNLNYKKNFFFFSLVVCIYKKDYKFYKLFKSLNLQSFKNFEVILVDQNNCLLSIKKKLFNFNIKHIKSKIGLSLSRNRGIDLSDGKYICFPDDDCFYHKDTLLNAYKIINQTKCEVATGRTVDLNYKNTLLNYPLKKTYFTKIDIIKNICSVTFFIKKNKLRFDTNLGLGSKKNISGEETDYLLRIKDNLNYKICYKPDILIFHKDFEKEQLNSNKNENFFIKSYNYGFGSSIVLKKNNLKLLNFLIILKIILNLISSLFKFKYKSTKFIYYNLSGRLRGIFN